MGYTSRSMDRRPAGEDAARETELRNANAAGKRRELADPSLGETDKIRGRTVWALVAAGTDRGHAIAVADKITRQRVGDEAWKRYQTHRLHAHRSAATLRANGAELAPTPAT